jgi:uncharacterized membrane protein
MEIVASMMRRAIVLLPFFIFFGSWSVLTAAGAVLATTSSGQQALRTFTGWLPENVAADIGSPTYWLLLLLPFAVVPATGWVGYRLARSAVPSASAEVSTPMLLVLSATGFAYCFWTLYSIGYWVPGLLFDELGYSALILRRVAIIESAGFLFYAVIYAILPMCSALFLAKLLKRWSWPDFVGLMCTFAACYYLTFAIYMKLPLVIYFGTLGLAVIFSRRGWLLLPVIAVAAVGTFLSLQSLIGGGTSKGTRLHRHRDRRFATGLLLHPGSVPRTRDILLRFRVLRLSCRHLGASDNSRRGCGSPKPYFRASISMNKPLSGKNLRKNQRGHNFLASASSAPRRR